MTFPPPIYEKIRKSRLIPEGSLVSALKEFQEKLVGLGELAPEKLDNEFLALLENNNLLNRWQISQLKRGHSRFRLGRYRVIDSLGSGGYGYVFLARTDNDPSNFDAVESNGRRPYDSAVKTLIRSEKHGPLAIERFRRENEINRLFVHPNLVQLRDAGEDGKVFYAVYEYMDGKSAYQLVTKNQRLSSRVASFIISETAKGLFHLHQHGFIHRDIKPGNILFNRTGEVKLGDLGLAVPMNAEKFRPLLGPDPDEFRTENPAEMRVAGTSDYLPPDQILAPGAPNVLWDIYSLGCTFFFLVAGFVPFPSGTAHQKLHAHLAAEVPDPKMYCPELPWDLARLISAMMDKDPGNRPATAEEIYKRLKPFVLGGKTELKSLLKGMLSPSLAKPEYDPTSVRAKTASDSAILDALDREASQSFEAISGYGELPEPTIPPVILPDPDSAPERNQEADPDSGSDRIYRVLVPILWAIVGLLLALYAILLFR